MSRGLAEWLTRPRVARIIVAITAVVGLGAAVLSTYVDHDDDVLAFLPDRDPDVAAFHALNRAFGGLEVAIVGIEADNPLDPELFDKLRTLTKVLNDAPEVRFALSLANVSDFQPSPDGGIETDLLVREVPDSPDGQRALRQKVMSRDLVVGQLIAPGGKATILYAFAAFGSDQRTFATTIRREVLARFPVRSVYFGGAPFVAGYIYDSTQADLRRLTPWAVLAIVLLVFAAFRDVRGVLLALVATTLGIFVALGLMVVTGHRYNIVLSSMPVILFSVGSAYSIHVLARYYALAADFPPREALIRSLHEVGPTVLAAGGTTAAGLLSFLTMDIQPLRSFGLFTAAGIGAALLSSLTFVPAMVVVLGIRRGAVRGPSVAWLVRATAWLDRRRRPAIVGLAVVSAISVSFITRVDTRMDQSAFFADDSPPARADRFLRRHFGGAAFIQVHGRGDFTSAATLRVWSALADELEALPHVSSVQHVGQIVAQLNAALAGQRRLPDTSAQVKVLYRFLAGEPAIDQLVTADRRQAVMHIKVLTSDLDETEATLAAVEALTQARLQAPARVTTTADARAGPWLITYLAQRIETLCRRADVPLTAEARAAVVDFLRTSPPPPPPAEVEAHLRAYLRSPESLVEVDEPTSRRLAAALRLDEPPRQAALTAIVDDPDQREDPLYIAETEGPRAERAAQTDAWLAALKVDGLVWPGGQAGVRLKTRIRDELSVRVAPSAEIPQPAVGTTAASTDAGTLRISSSVSGLPVLHRGLSRSARQNQVASLIAALALVILVLCALFRSIRAGLAAAVPTLCTLAVVYGSMGALGVHLDIGTSMIASLIIGAGVDYAVHLVAAHRAALRAQRPDPLAAAVESTGTAIWTNALMVAAGFYLLTLGEARTLQNVGGLTAAAMVVAALTTFGVVPALLPRRLPDAYETIR